MCISLKSLSVVFPFIRVFLVNLRYRMLAMVENFFAEKRESGFFYDLSPIMSNPLSFYGDVDILHVKIKKGVSS